MASRTRSSPMPRARSCEVTICWRRPSYVEGLSEDTMQDIQRESRPILFLPSTDAHIEADHTVLVARTQYRYVAVDVVLALNDLLRTLRDIGAVTQRQVVGEFFFDGDLRSTTGGICLGARSLWIDLDATDAEQLLHSASDRGVNGLIDDQVGRRVAEQRLPGLLL